MLDNKGFDLWADGYDKSVGVSEEDNTYPFAGYKKILGNIYEIIMKKPNAVVLDIGFGTAALTTKLYENGCVIYGQDFSARMIELASEKMPDAHLYQGDFTQGLVEPLQQKSYDFIVKTPPVAVQLMEVAKIKGGSAEPNRKKVAEITWDQVRTIAQDKMPDLNCFTVEAAMTLVAGTARSMGITVKGEFPGK